MDVSSESSSLDWIGVDSKSIRLDPRRARLLLTEPKYLYLKINSNTTAKFDIHLLLSECEDMIGQVLPPLPEAARRYYAVYANDEDVQADILLLKHFFQFPSPSPSSPAPPTHLPPHQSRSSPFPSVEQERNTPIDCSQVIPFPILSLIHRIVPSIPSTIHPSTLPPTPTIIPTNRKETHPLTRHRSFPALSYR
jgi:hypothetical protein